eukprot:SAG11_NODE_2602_length_3180_cov_1.885427_3_plen_347_part_01
MDALVSVTPLPPGVTAEVFKVIHLYCNQSSLYRLKGDRWIPDALVPLADLTSAGDSSFTLDVGLAHSFWVRLSVDATAAPGTYDMQVRLKFATLDIQQISVPLALKIWDIDPLPGLASPSSLGTIFAFNSSKPPRGPGSIDSYYKDESPAFVQEKYMDVLASERIPGGSCYLHAPRQIEYYEQLAASGSRYMGLLDVSVAGSNGSMRVNYTQSQIDFVLAVLAPIVTQLTQRGLLDRAYVYGFDERPQSAEWVGAINQMFGAIKVRFPGLRTVAALRWRAKLIDGGSVLQLAKALDVWVQLYSLYNDKDAAQWQALGGTHEAWAYHCVSPRPTLGPAQGEIGPMRWL